MLAGAVEAITRQVDELATARALLEHLLSCPDPDPVRNCTFLRAELDQAVTEALRP